MFRRLSVLILAASASLSGAAANREMQELQRDVAQLQDLVKALQSSINERFATLQTQVQGSSDAARQANAAVAAVQRSLDQLARDEQNKLVPPMVAMGTRMDQVSNGLSTVQQAVSDLAGLMAKLQTQLGDLNNAVKVALTPPTPPPQQQAADKPSLPAGTMFENANADYHSGKLVIALQEFQEYMKFYADTPLASEAQYYIGSIHQSQNDLEAAVKDYDLLISNYPDSKKLPDALFYKGKDLMLLGRTSEATDTFNDLRKRFPTSDQARQSRTIKPAGRE
ncbi:MAG TPA: tetratricopeptide repeat protein [Bryobacteraceae bacterium]|nr:tetratricopeptide repeat protein [Bryobacteraceae bacterium]